AFLGRQLGHRALVADADQVGVHLAVPKEPQRLFSRFGIALFEPCLPRLDIGPEPVQSQCPQAVAFLLVELVGVLALVAARQGRVAGGVVAVLGLGLIRQLGLGGKRLLIKLGCSVVESLELANLAIIDALLRTARLNLSLQHCWKLGVKVRKQFSPADGLPRGVRPLLYATVMAFFQNLGSFLELTALL